MLDNSATIEQLRDALNIKPPDCAGIAASYVCGNHDNVPTYSGEIIPAKAGDELAMNSMIISVVDIDGSGNGSGLIKMPMMNNIKLGLTLTGIKVAKGGCIVAGSAELSGVSASILNDQQRANLQKAYAAYNQVIENTGAIIETYDNFSQMVNGVQKKAAALVAKIGSGGKPTQAEVAALKSLTAQTTANMQASLDAIKKQMGEQVNAEAAAKLQAMIDQNKANAAALTAPASGQPTPAALAAAASSLAATQPAQVEKQIKELPPLAVEYNKRIYVNNNKITISNQEQTPTFALKNGVEGEAISWIIKAANQPFFTPTANPMAFIWPDGQTTLMLEVSQGTRKAVLTLQRKTFTYTDLVAIDKNSPDRKALASKNETLYLVRSPNSIRTIEYKMQTTATRNDFVGSEPVWTTTLPNNGGIYEGKVLNGINSPIGETRHNSAAKGNVTAKAFDFDKNVAVQVVDQSRHAVDFMPPGVSNLLTSTYNKTKQGMEQVQRVLANFGKAKLEAKPLKIKGEGYNEEIDNSRHYAVVIDANIEGGLEMISDKIVFAPPIIKPLNIDGISRVGMYFKPGLDIPISGGIETKKVFETGKYLINKPFYASVGAKGCIEAGLVAELLAAKALVDFEVRGYGKGCLSGGWKFQNNNIKDPIFKIELDPVIVGVSAKIKSKGYLTFTLVDTAYEYALTKPFQIYPRN